MPAKMGVIPGLEAQNLYAARITGNGNCLFNALSDQLHGDESLHAEYRSETVKYMRDHPDDFKFFVPVHPGGATRRSKRKMRGALQRSVDLHSHTVEEIDVSFAKYLKDLEQYGAYGSHPEIVAFANVYHVNVHVYSETYGEFDKVDYDNESGEAVKTAYIVHHEWEHFTSIRNKSGPHTGLPHVNITPPPAGVKATAKADADTTTKDKPVKEGFSRPWVVDLIQKALPYAATRESIVEALKAYKGNYAKAVSALMPTSSESSSRSSSIERDSDNDEDLDRKPKKKADRRSSRPHPLPIGKSDKSFNDDGNGNGWHSITPDASQLSAALSKLTGDDPDDSEAENWHNEPALKESETTSVSTSTSNSSATNKGSSDPIVRIKLSQPRKPNEKLKPTSTASSEKSPGGEYDADAEKPQPPRVIAKPRGRLISGLERERLRAEKAQKQSLRASLSPTSANSKKSKKSPPVLGVGIKVLSL